MGKSRSYLGVGHLERPLSTREVAERLEISVRHVYEIVEKGELHPTKRLGKLHFDPAEVRRYDGGERDEVWVPIERVLGTGASALKVSAARGR